MRMIDADALANAIVSVYGEDGLTEDASLIYGLLLNTPTIDAVEVVRCKDCFLEDCKAKEFYGENGFCSIGERREP